MLPQTSNFKTQNNMITRKPKEIKTKILIFIVSFYTFLTNLKDVKEGFNAGWNSLKVEKQIISKIEK
jgi:hypothetical protein